MIKQETPLKTVSDEGGSGWRLAEMVFSFVMVLVG